VSNYYTNARTTTPIRTITRTSLAMRAQANSLTSVRMAPEITAVSNPKIRPSRATVRVAFIT
jgi:hypothetical protein